MPAPARARAAPCFDAYPNAEINEQLRGFHHVNAYESDGALFVGLGSRLQSLRGSTFISIFMQ